MAASVVATITISDAHWISFGAVDSNRLDAGVLPGAPEENHCEISQGSKSEALICARPGVQMFALGKLNSRALSSFREFRRQGPAL